MRQIVQLEQCAGEIVASSTRLMCRYDSIVSIGSVVYIDEEYDKKLEIVHFDDEE